jgi:hypothetical protein
VLFIRTRIILKTLLRRGHVSAKIRLLQAVRVLSLKPTAVYEILSIKCIISSIRKSKVRPRTGHEGPEGKYRYSSTLSLTFVLDEGGWVSPRPGRFTLVKGTQPSLYRSLGVFEGLSGWVRKILLLHRDSIPVLSNPYRYTV